MATRDHLDLLIKLLKLTASPQDNEALAAVRKANAILTLAEWDWERLLRGKVTIIGDPFGSVVAPAQQSGMMNNAWRPPQGNGYAQQAAAYQQQQTTTSYAPPPPRAKAPRPARAPRQKRTTLADLGLT